MLTILISLCTAVLPEDALSKDLKKIVSNIQNRYDSIQTLKVDFYQEVSFEGRKGALKAAGTAFFKKPGMTKWEYTTPEKQQIISNGSDLWIYQPKLNQVMLSEFSKERSAAQDFLSGMGKLDKDFSIELIEEDKKVYLLGLNPRTPQTNIKSLSMKINKDSFMMLEVTSIDLLGNATTIKLKNIKTNIPLSSALFTFKIPEGTKVVETQDYRPY